MFLLFFFLQLIFNIQVYARTLFDDDFEQKVNSKVLRGLTYAKDLVEIVPYEGVNRSSGLKVTYEANKEGSKRLVASYDLTFKVKEASLSFDVKFEENFQFVKGGKLHGLGPVNPITGGQAMNNSGWSSRIMFEEDGAVATYIYHQLKTGDYGETHIGDSFRFQKGKFYSLTLYTKLNSSPNIPDGIAQIYVDGMLITEQRNVLYWKASGDESKISKFLFSTFHGGHNPSWAPKDKNGKFINVHALFDNFIVEEGL